VIDSSASPNIPLRKVTSPGALPGRQKSTSWSATAAHMPEISIHCQSPIFARARRRPARRMLVNASTGHPDQRQPASPESPHLTEPAASAGRKLVPLRGHGQGRPTPEVPTPTQRGKKRPPASPNSSHCAATQGCGKGPEATSGWRPKRRLSSAGLLQSRAGPHEHGPNAGPYAEISHTGSVRGETPPASPNPQTSAATRGCGKARSARRRPSLRLAAG
jgi:hypothetical protein